MENQKIGTFLLNSIFLLSGNPDKKNDLTTLLYYRYPDVDEEKFVLAPFVPFPRRVRKTKWSTTAINRVNAASYQPALLRCTEHSRLFTPLVAAR